MRKPILLPVLIFGLVAASSLVVAQTADPFIGTWKLNVVKSKYDPGPAPKSRTLKMEPAANGFKQVLDTVDAEGKSSHAESVIKLDGREYPQTTPNTTRTMKPINERSYEAVERVNGKVTTTTRVVISADGKTWTTTQTGTNAQGQAVHNLWIYDRQ